jgi:uncharacterized protein YerC
MAALSDRRRRAIEALLMSKSTADAAARSGIGARTIERWKRELAFRDALRAASQALLHDTLAKMRAATGRALDALTAALDEAHSPTRVRAAIALLDLATKIDIDDLARRFEVLEAALGRQR